MSTATQRVGALLAGGAALFALAMSSPAVAGGKPAPGSVGNADDKAPPGQTAGDHNSGYECDGNNGVGKGNPAHTGCADVPAVPDDPYDDGGDDEWDT